MVPRIVAKNTVMEIGPYSVTCLAGHFPKTATANFESEKAKQDAITLASNFSFWKMQALMLEKG